MTCLSMWLRGGGVIFPNYLFFGGRYFCLISPTRQAAIQSSPSDSFRVYYCIFLLLCYYVPLPQGKEEFRAGLYSVESRLARSARLVLVSEGFLFSAAALFLKEHTFWVISPRGVSFLNSNNSRVTWNNPTTVNANWMFWFNLGSFVYAKWEWRRLAIWKIWFYAHTHPLWNSVFAKHKRDKWGWVSGKFLRCLGETGAIVSSSWSRFELHHLMRVDGSSVAKLSSAQPPSHVQDWNIVDPIIVTSLSTDIANATFSSFTFFPWFKTKRPQKRK